jgi:sporulation protein YlmC with PRC-barrel domain
LSQPARVIPLEDWSYSRLYRGMTAKALMSAEVDGAVGRGIGKVENLIVDRQGTLVGVVVRVGGIWVFGGTRLAVPWEQIDLNRSGKEWALRLPLTRQGARRYGAGKDDHVNQTDVGRIAALTAGFTTGAPLWKATDLLDDHVVIRDGQSYGYVADLIFSFGGRLESIVADATNGDVSRVGYYAYPWYGGGSGDDAWEPSQNYYVLPYGEKQIASLDVFDYGVMDPNRNPRR